MRKQLRLQREAAAATAAAVTLQSAFRRFVAQTRFAGARAAATTLASYWRCVTATRAFRHQRRRGGASAGASPPGGIALPRRPWRGGGVATPVPRCGGTVDFPAHPCRGHRVPGRLPPRARGGPVLQTSDSRNGVVGEVAWCRRLRCRCSEGPPCRHAASAVPPPRQCRAVHGSTVCQCNAAAVVPRHHDRATVRPRALCCSATASHMAQCAGASITASSSSGKEEGWAGGAAS